MGKNDIQASQMLVPGPEEGESGGQNLLSLESGPNSISVEKTCE